MESEFSSGLEFRDIWDLEKTIIDLDWAATPDLQSILAIGTARRVEILCQQRMTYFNQEAAWTTCAQVDISSYAQLPRYQSIRSY